MYFTRFLLIRDKKNKNQGTQRKKPEGEKYGNSSLNSSVTIKAFSKRRKKETV